MSVKPVYIILSVAVHYIHFHLYFLHIVCLKCVFRLLFNPKNETTTFEENTPGLAKANVGKFLKFKIDDIHVHVVSLLNMI